MSCCHGNDSLRSSSSLFPWSSSCGPAQEQLYPCTRKCQPSLMWCTKRQVIRWRKVIYRQRMWLSPAPTPPLGTGSFLLQSSVSPELKWILELSHWHRSALLYTHGRKLHKGKKKKNNTLSNRQRDPSRTGENLADPITAMPQLLQLTYGDMKLSVNITIFPLLTSSPWEMRGPSKWKQRPPWLHFRNTYLRLPTVRICHRQPPLLPIYFANSAVAIFSPFILGSDKSLSFQYISYLLQKLLWTSTSTWNRRRLHKTSTPATLSV